MDKNIKAQIDKIISYFNAGNYKEVFNLSNILLKKNPELDFVLNIVGLCYQKLNDFEKAEIFFSRAMNINKKNINAITEIYNILSIIKEFLCKFIDALNLNVNDLKSKFNEDKVIFFEHFKLLYYKEGV